MNTDTLHTLALSFTQGIGPVTARALVRHFGSAEAVYTAPEEHLLRLGGIGPKITARIRADRSKAMDRAHQELAFAKKHSIRILTAQDPAFPKRLRHCPDAPLIVYVKGDVHLNASRILSIVGTRNATSYGKGVCKDLIDALKAYDVLVVSGLAYGIDSAAHRYSLDNQIPTVGVLGHGLDQLYPAQNRRLAVSMLENGGLLTEFPSETKMVRTNFPQRNRIIAGLADVTIVVEAAIKGGALITAEMANQYHRDVCAFPGSIEAKYSEGCHLLIKTHRAHLITGAKDLAYLMNWEPVNPVSEVPHKMASHINPQQQKIVDLITQQQQLSIDALSQQMNLPASTLAIALLDLEMNGLIVSLPGKIYRIC